MGTNQPIRRAAGATLTAVATLALAAGCGDHGGTDGGAGHDMGRATTAATSSVAATDSHNQADITFAQGMVPHHQQAVVMADLAATRASAAEVKALAAKIKQAQAPEIEQLNGWLTGWGAAMPSAPAGGGHDMPGMNPQMPGMMTDKDMADLKTATGAGFDRMFLQMMIRHHQGAVEMARTQQQQGKGSAVKALAARIEADQTAEITQMQALLAK
ncbi:MAG TPA: DUF305 domain-containing protein [Catenuloplanes sp.]|jgi:uncharacterized protein (DUF305 family)